MFGSHAGFEFICHFGVDIRFEFGFHAWFDCDLNDVVCFVWDFDADVGVVCGMCCGVEY